MDPKKLAEEILEQLFPQNEEELFEEKDEDEDEDEGEEDEGEYEGEEEEGPEHEENEPAGHEAAEAKGGNSSKNQASVAMKPSMASPAVNAGPNNASGNSVQDAHGGTPTPVNGKPKYSITFIEGALSGLTVYLNDLTPGWSIAQVHIANKASLAKP
jgi:hypothetical protein